VGVRMVLYAATNKQTDRQTDRQADGREKTLAARLAGWLVGRLDAACGVSWVSFCRRSICIFSIFCFSCVERRGHSVCRSTVLMGGWANSRNGWECQLSSVIFLKNVCV